MKTGVAVWEASFGDAPEARREGDGKEHGAFQGPGCGIWRCLRIGACGGDMSRSEALANDLERRFPEDNSRQIYLPAYASRIIRKNGTAASLQKAIELLQAAAPYDLALSGIAFFGFFGGLYPAYVRGEAFSGRTPGAEAAVEFQKLLDHRGRLVFGGDPMGALARLQLGRAFVMSGR